jgi:hypothetical protein
MRPGLFTRMSDRAVTFFSRFEGDGPEPRIVLSELSAKKSAIGIATFFGLSAIFFSVAGRLDQAPLFFGTQAAVMVGVKAWFGWHRRNPPLRNAGSSWRGVLGALGHAAGAFCVGLFILYVLRRAIPVFAEGSVWLEMLKVLAIASGLAVFTYQRRTGWRHDDPERSLIIVPIAMLFAAADAIFRFLF